jgi:hypothetical protein
MTKLMTIVALAVTLISASTLLLARPFSRMPSMARGLRRKASSEETELALK